MLMRTTALRSRPFFTRARPALVAFGISLPFLHQRPATRLDASPQADFSSSFSHAKDGKVPLTKDGRTLNPAAVKQISMGSILGLGAGFLLSAFSRSLTLLLGVGIVVWQVRQFPRGEHDGESHPCTKGGNANDSPQYAARKGYNIIPVDRVQRYVSGVNLRSAINDNVAFKISFGVMFALSAFGEF